MFGTALCFYLKKVLDAPLELQNKTVTDKSFLHKLQLSQWMFCKKYIMLQPNKSKMGLVLKKLWRNQWWASFSMMVNLPCFLPGAPLEILNTTMIYQGFLNKQHTS